MIPKECKRLAEVDFPIAAVSVHSAREKSIRHGHPSTLHLWWARRPLAACRAMLIALLLPDPCDPHCPDEFKADARRILLAFAGRPSGWDKTLKTDAGLRHAVLHEFIADFANWDNAGNPAYLKTARALVKAAHGEEAPLVVDPFAGGGSIPLEALRIGCDAFASDLNPVACLINKVLLEDIPRYGSKLAESFRVAAAETKKQADEGLAEFYPSGPNGDRPIAYLWARTIQCEQPNCGCEIPLVRSFWLSKKGSRRQALKYTLKRSAGNPPSLEFSIFSPTGESELQSGTVANAKATCPACKQSLAPTRVRAQLYAHRGGADTLFDEDGRRVGGARLLAVVSTQERTSGRLYRSPDAKDYRAVFRAQQAIRRAQQGDADGEHLTPPQESISTTELRRISLPLYGILDWKDAFTARQLLALGSLCKAAGIVGNDPALRHVLALALGRAVNSVNTICRWHLTGEKIEGAYGRQALGMVWDFCEANPTSDSTGSFAGAIGWITAVVEAWPGEHSGQVHQADAAASLQSDDAAHVWFTDPPYYDSVPYSHLSDFVYVWLRRFLGKDAQIGFASGLTPKREECVVDRAHTANPNAKNRQFFETKMGLCMAEGRRVTRPDGIGSVVFAHKSTEGWEALLGGIRDAGWVITASWPIATEMSERLNARDTASLATSIHLVCRPRDDSAGIGDWGAIIRDLPKRITDWMDRLGGEGIRGADLVFACIGPALELFSRYARVETPDGEEVGLAANENAHGEPARRGFLSYVWEVAGRTALNQVLGSAESKARNGAAGALEEDARLTALFLWTLQATDAKAAAKSAKADGEDEEDDAADEESDEEESGGGGGGKRKGLTMIYDVARRFAQPLGIHLEAWEGRIIETAKGIVRLLPVQERARQLFGEEGASAVVRKFEAEKKPNPQFMLEFMAEQRAAIPEVKTRGRRKKAGDSAAAEGLRTRKEATTLDRVHAAMLLQSGGASNALRSLVQAEIQRSPDFLRLANALSALYPRDSEEKRLLDAMLLAVPR